MKAPKVRWEIADSPATIAVGPVQDAAKAEFERLLAEQGMPTWLSDVQEIERFEAIDGDSAGSVESGGVGRKIAKAVHRGPRP